MFYPSATLLAFRYTSSRLKNAFEFWQSKAKQSKANAINLLVVQNFIEILFTDTWKTQTRGRHFVSNRTQLPHYYPTGPSNKTRENTHALDALSRASVGMILSNTIKKDTHLFWMLREQQKLIPIFLWRFSLGGALKVIWSVLMWGNIRCGPASPFT